MVQKRKLGILMTLCLILILSVSTLFILRNTNNESVLADSITTELEDEYFYGETIDIPSAKLTIGSQEYDSSDVVVICPDGSAQKTSRLTIVQHGLYKVRYYATTDAGKVYQEDEFMVRKDLVSFDSKTSSYYIGKNEEYDCTGLNLSIAVNDEAKINKVLNLKGATFKNSFMKFLLTPLTIGQADARQLFVKLTDIYDSENYVILRFQNWSDMGAWANGTSYIDAKAPGQDWTSSLTKENGVHKRGKLKGWYTSQFSFTGTNEKNERFSNPLELFFSEEDRQFETSSNVRAGTYGNTCIVDLDDPYWYDLMTEKLWGGFTTGEVYLSFYAGTPVGSSMNLCIYNMLGTSFDSLDADIRCPDVTVSYDEENVPFAIVNEKFNIFEAKAVDLEDGNVEVICNVFYDYNGANKEIIDIDGGAFTPKKAGIYTIVYKAKDLSGNITTKAVDVEAKADVDDAVVTIKNPVKAINLGDSAKLFSEIYIENTNGEAIVDVLVRKGNNVYKPDKNNVFTPNRIGIHTVVVTIKDYTSTSEQSFDFEVINTSVPKISETVIIPKYFIKGAEYTLPDMYGDIYIGNDLNKIKAECFYQYEGESRVKVTPDFVLNKVGPVKIIYEVNNAGSISSKVIDCLVLDTGYDSEDGLQISKYFYNKTLSGQMVAKEEYIEYSSSANSEFEFINAVQSSELDFSFRIDPTKNKLNEVYFWLIDSSDSSIKLKLRFVKSDKSTRVYLNESELYSVTALTFNEIRNLNFTFSYNDSTRLLKCLDDVSLTVNEDYYGNKFNGFPSKKVYISIGMDGVTDDSLILLKKLNNQGLFEQTRDEFKPQIILGSKSASLPIHGTYTLKKPSIADVLDPDLTYTLIVKDPDGEYATSVDGVVLNGKCEVMRDYQIKLDKLGGYSVEYTAKDNAAYKPVAASFFVNTEDMIAPEIKVIDIVRTASVGDTVNLAKLEVTDDVTTQCKVQYTVLRPDNENVYVTDSFVADIAGEYVVCIYAFDEAFNASFAQYTVVVK